MPCACLLPLPNYPTNEAWGPILWAILHSLAEKYNKLVSMLYKKEEELYWTNLIKLTESILPCKDCRNHYKDYLSKKKINLKEPDFVKLFFYNLHNDINLRNDKPLFDYSNLNITYKDTNINYLVKQFEKILDIVFQYNEVSLVSWKKWYSNYIKLQNIYGI
jgi:hypothetical protein